MMPASPERWSYGGVETGMIVVRVSRPLGVQLIRAVIHALSEGEDVNSPGLCKELTLSQSDSWITSHGGGF